MTRFKITGAAVALFSALLLGTPSAQAGGGGSGAGGAGEDGGGMGFGGDKASGQQASGVVVTRLSNPLFGSISEAGEIYGDSVQAVVSLAESNDSKDEPVNCFAEITCESPGGGTSASGPCAADVCKEVGTCDLDASKRCLSDADCALAPPLGAGGGSCVSKEFLVATELELRANVVQCLVDSVASNPTLPNQCSTGAGLIQAFAPGATEARIKDIDSVGDGVTRTVFTGGGLDTTDVFGVWALIMSFK